MKKSLFTLFLIFAFMLSSLSVYANVTENLQETKAAKEARDMKIKLDGKIVTAVDDSGNKYYPVLIDGRSYLPLRALGNLVGVTVGFNSDTRRITIDTKTAKTQKFAAEQPIGKQLDKKASIVKDMYLNLNGDDIFPKDSTGVPVYPAIIDGRSYLPIRATESVFGIKVDYDTPSRTIIIKTKNYVEVASDGYTLETESNDNLRTANVIPVNGGKMKGTVAEVGNGTDQEVNLTDYYKVSVTENGLLTVKLTGDGRADCRITIVDKEGNYIWAEDLPVENVLTKTIGFEKMDVYMYVEGFNTDTTTYKLDTTFVPYAKDVEPNDEYANAQTYTLGTAVTGVIGSIQNNSSYDLDSADIYKVNVANLSTFKINLTSKYDLRVTVYDKEQNWIGSLDTVQNKINDTIIDENADVHAGDFYYISVSGTNGGDQDSNIYTLTVN